MLLKTFLWKQFKATLRQTKDKVFWDTKMTKSFSVLCEDPSVFRMFLFSHILSCFHVLFLLTKKFQDNGLYYDGTASKKTHQPQIVFYTKNNQFQVAREPNIHGVTNYGRCGITSYWRQTPELHFLPKSKEKISNAVTCACIYIVYACNSFFLNAEK